MEFLEKLKKKIYILRGAANERVVMKARKGENFKENKQALHYEIETSRSQEKKKHNGKKEEEK